MKLWSESSCESAASMNPSKAVDDTPCRSGELRGSDEGSSAAKARLEEASTHPKQIKRKPGFMEVAFVPGLGSGEDENRLLQPYRRTRADQDSRPGQEDCRVRIGELS
jgi:hypothetical protein